MNSLIPHTGLAWLSLSLPAHHYAISIVQQALCTQAKSWCFTEKKIQQMELAVEEAVTTILQLIHGSTILDINTPSVGHFDIKITALETVLQFTITDYDLPYDLSMIPIFSLQQAEENEVDDGLSFFILRQLVDDLRVTHPGINGQSLELEWRFSPEQTSQRAEKNTVAHLDLQATASQSIQIRPLIEKDAIYLARLMHQNYGYSYVNPDLYIAEKISLRHQDGRLTSLVAVEDNGQLVGHCALMKSHADSEIVELGAAVVSPYKQGLGIFNSLWQSLEDQLIYRHEKVACVHAVTCHSYTQKTVLKHNYVISGLMLGYTPTTILFKSVKNQNIKERGSVYYCCKLLKSIPSMVVYLPKEDQRLVMEMAQQIGMALMPQPINLYYVDQGKTTLNYHVEVSLNIAFLSCDIWAEQGGQELKRLWKYLCRERVDVIYATIDLTQPHAPALAQRLRELGFISGGFVPYMPDPATLLLQYLNNQNLTESSVDAVGENAQLIKDHVFSEYKAQEMLEA